MLLVVYTFNFIDRQILGILAGPIKADLHLSDTQLGALGGFAFALLYSTMGLPLAWLADRRGRTPVIAASLAMWSAFTALCGWRAAMGDVRVPPGRGRGRGGGVAPSYALISDYFPPQRRAGAGDLFAGHSAGVGAGILLGGYVAAAVNWRAAFLGRAGGAGVHPAVRAAGARSGRPGASPRRRACAMCCASWRPSAVLARLWRGLGSMMGYGLAFWLPSLMRRSFGLGLVETSQFFGLLLLIGGSAGVLAGGWAADWLGRRSRAAYAMLPALLPAGVPLFAPGFSRAAALLAVPAAAGAGLSVARAGADGGAASGARPDARHRLGQFLLINNLIGVGWAR
jgi:MFS family permease